jgi:glycosyltransferase involved in cell wall biosynthesis
LKVVHVIEALGGGVYTYFKDLSFYFGDEEISNNIDTTIIYSGNRKEIDPKKIKKDFSNGVTLIEVDMIKNLSPLMDLKSTFKLYKELKKLKPDVIHLHSSKAGVLGRVAAFFLFKKKKVFYTPHGYSFLRADISKFNKSLFWFIEKSFQIIFGGTTIACGDTEYEISKKIGKSYLVRNGINVQEIKTNNTENNNQVLTIGIVARITFARNPKLFNKIALQNPNVNFVWIGDGDMREYLTADNIRITGWMLNNSDVMKELNKIDIYIQTSLWEGLPIAVLEAMAMEKPVIASNIIGNKDIVVHNETGFLFDEIDEIEQYVDILSCKKTRKEFGEKGLKRCLDLFDKNKNFKELISIYKL